ncbi:hypothetical protein D3C76_1006160 [compost metagenome]
MDNNIVDFTTRFQLKKELAEKPVPLEGYQLPNSEILMDPSLKLNVLLQHSADKFLDGDMDAYKIHRLLSLMAHVYAGFVPTFDLKTSMVIRKLPTEASPTDFSVYSWGIAMDRMLNRENEETPSFRPSYQLEAQLIEVDEGTVTKVGTIYPDEWMDFSFAEDDIITARTPKHFIRRMNDLVKINGGKGILTSEGGYLVALPYGGRLAYMIALVIENPIVLLPEDQRKPL